MAAHVCSTDESALDLAYLQTRLHDAEIATTEHAHFRWKEHNTNISNTLLRTQEQLVAAIYSSIILLCAGSG